jgi:hypothetical protein
MIDPELFTSTTLALSGWSLTMPYVGKVLNTSMPTPHAS